MAILSWPAGLRAPSASDWGLRPNEQIAESPFTRSVQAIEFPGARWRGTLVWRGLLDADYRALSGFLSRLRGRVNGFTFTPPAVARRATISGTPLIKGAGQVGNSILTDGWPSNSATPCFATGDYVSLQMGGLHRLHQIVQDAGSNASGECAMIVEPPTRGSPADNAAITIVDPIGTFRAAEPEWQAQQEPGYRAGAIAIPFRTVTLGIIESLNA